MEMSYQKILLFKGRVVRLSGFSQAQAVDTYRGATDSSRNSTWPYAQTTHHALLTAGAHRRYSPVDLENGFEPSTFSSDGAVFELRDGVGGA